MKTSTILSDAFLRCLSPEDRQSLGKGGMTAEEAIARWEVRNERDLQKVIAQLLGLKGIAYCWHRTDKKSAATIGWPDFTFAVSLGNHLLSSYEAFPCAWEVKFGGGDLSVEQTQMAIRLQSPPNAWLYRVIRSVDQAIAELREMGAT